ncbi:SEA (Seh1-associated) complex subunit [Dipsacomyces acuminosporus]|nr:SEA (Seh1-associated) complex subunit [Dipsacomyces acuminosporus]
MPTEAAGALPPQGYDLASGAQPSPDNEPGDSMHGRALRYSASKDVLLANQPRKMRTQQQSPSRKVCLYIPPGERSPKDDALSETADPDRPADALTSAPMHSRHGNSHIPGPIFSSQTNSASASSADSLAVPANTTRSTFGSDHSGRQVTISGDSGRSDLPAISDEHRNSSYLPDDNDENGGDVANAGQQARNPWSFAYQKARKRTLKYHLPGRWNAVAPSPDKKPLCAVAGHEGLVVLKMDADSIHQESHLTRGRRWDLSLDFKDVIWRPLPFITTGSNDGTVTVWDPMSRNSDQVVHRFSDCSRPVNRLAYRPGDQSSILAAFSDGSIVARDIRVPRSRTPVFRWSASLSAQDVHYNPQDGNMFATITQDGRVLMWDHRNPKEPPGTFIAHPASRGQCIAWHPNGRFIASGGSDQYIKVWDVKLAVKKFAATEYSKIKTFAHVHKLQWRPGHDTQISSCALVSDSRFQVWDMSNTNHSLMYHDQHSSQVTGFTWFDKNTVWTSSRDCNIVQCDMLSDGIDTAGLMGKTVAAFSPTSHLAVATGEIRQRYNSASASSSENYQSDSYASSRSDASYQELSYLAKFQPNHPLPFLDEHVLDTSISVRSLAITFLARSYKYDPDAFAECCQNNSSAAAAVGSYEVAKFWQFLSALLGNSLPLNSRLKARKSQKGSAEDAKDSAAARPRAKAKQRLKTLVSESKSVRSQATSQASSGMFPSKSVIDALPEADSSDDEPSARSPFAPSFASLSRQSSQMSLAPIHKTPSTASIADALSHMRIDRHDYAHSSTNTLEQALALQKPLLSAKNGNAPSPLSKAITQSISSPSISGRSEPLSPQQDFHAFGRSQTANPTLASIAPTPKSPTHKASGDTKEGTPQIQSRASLVLEDGNPLYAAQSSALQTAKAIESLSAVKLQIKTQQHATKADLKIVIQSCEYYAHQGDVQTAVTVALLMRKFIRLSKWARTEPWFLAYVDQLDQYREFTAATEIMLASPFESVRDAIMSRNAISMDCSQCGSPLMLLPGVGIGYCADCSKPSNSCVVCEEPVRGRFIWCQGCGHGGHSEHLATWFEDMKQSACPAGCGHTCVNLLSAGSL